MAAKDQSEAKPQPSLVGTRSTASHFFREPFEGRGGTRPYQISSRPAVCAETRNAACPSLSAPWSGCLENVEKVSDFLFHFCGAIHGAGDFGTEKIAEVFAEAGGSHSRCALAHF